MVDSIFDSSKERSLDKISTAIQFYRKQGSKKDERQNSSLDYIEDNFETFVNKCETSKKKEKCPIFYKTLSHISNTQLKDTTDMNFIKNRSDIIDSYVKSGGDTRSYYVGNVNITHNAYFKYKNRNLFNKKYDKQRDKLNDTLDKIKFFDKNIAKEETAKRKLSMQLREMSKIQNSFIKVPKQDTLKESFSNNYFIKQHNEDLKESKSHVEMKNKSLQLAAFNKRKNQELAEITNISAQKSIKLSKDLDLSLFNALKNSKNYKSMKISPQRSENEKVEENIRKDSLARQ